jgi:hypothetical protein
MAIPGTRCQAVVRVSAVVFGCAAATTHEPCPVVQARQPPRTPALFDLARTDEID